ncbi:MAG TPA: OmpA family protein [Salinivirgaceae bacterium]|nr:OmpA family protein [Salinivirgaceae bacterium]
MKRNLNRWIFPILVGLTFSCVPKRQFVELEMKADRTIRDRDSLKAINARLTVENTELKSELGLLRNDAQQSRDNLAEQIDSMRFYRSQYNLLSSINQELVRRIDEINRGVESENRQMLSELMQLKEDLTLREEKLRKLRDSLSVERRNLTMMKARLDDRNQILTSLDSLLKIKEQNLAEQSKKIAELQDVLQQKDRAVSELKDKVAKALVGFQNEGLKVEHRNGKVYVSMDEKLLFKSGRYDIDGRGRDALKRLSEVLAENKDVNIIIEGHTDDVPFNGRGEIKDNWDLSTKRATSVVRVLLENKGLSPDRVMAAGRAEFQPLVKGKTPEIRAKNRRTEIILTPKLDELLKILEAN